MYFADLTAQWPATKHSTNRQQTANNDKKKWKKKKQRKESKTMILIYLKVNLETKNILIVITKFVIEAFNA
jgi:hypothetical protein